MSRIKLAVAAAVVVGVLAAPAAARPRATILVATDGPGFTITLTKGGKKVTALPAGTYTIRVSDKSDIHNFHLKGPGLNKTTSVTGTGVSNWVVKLKAGRYAYVCDPHSSTMKGSFRVS
jgi:plastocyanin